MKAKVTMVFSEGAVDAFAEMFNVEDYSKLPATLEAFLLMTLKVHDECELLDNLTVEMIE